MFTFINLPTEDLNKNTYLENIIINKLHVRGHTAPSVFFKLHVHWLMGQGVLGEVDAQTLVWVVGVLQRDHVLEENN